MFKPLEGKRRSGLLNLTDQTLRAVTGLDLYLRGTSFESWIACRSNWDRSLLQFLKEGNGTAH
jgi:hypothetical protein